MSIQINKKYRCLSKQFFKYDDYSFIPIRYEDRFLIMKWRNEQIFHLRQSKILTEEDQEEYFSNIVSRLFSEENPTQILFSYLNEGQCIGYGGLVHINWRDKNAELSFLINTELEPVFFETHYSNYLKFIDELAFDVLNLHKVYSYAYDLRPKLYTVFENNGYQFDARLKNHIYFNNKFIDVVIHAKFKSITS